MPPQEVRGPDRAPSATTPGAAAPAPPWEALFQSASPEQQRELLALARRQGVLYAHQLPPLTHGAPPPAEGWRQLLTRLLAGQTDGVEPLRAPPAAVGDVPLDDVQRDAVARALGTPDVCLIQGLPGTGKSHVISEIVTRAAGRGERVLLLAPSPAPLDRVLETVGGRDMVCAIRCLGRDERPEALSPAVRALTFAERARSFQEHSLECAAREVQRAEERLARRRREEGVWPRLAELAGRLTQLGEALDALAKQRSAVPAAVEAEAVAAEEGRDEAPGSAAFRASVRERDRALAVCASRLKELRGRIDEKRRERDGLADQLNDLRPLVDAKQQKRWWTGSWWWATIQGNVIAKAGELQGQLEHIEKSLKDLDAESRQVTTDQEEAQARYRAERQRFVAAEVARRQGEIDDRDAALRQDRRLVQDKWQAACQELACESDRPAGTEPADVTAAAAGWERNLHGEEERLAFARQWSDCLRQAADTLPSRLLGYVNLVAATTAGLPADEHFGDASARTLHFDLLVLDHAHEVTESEFLTAARRARRWVLVGEPSEDVERLWRSLHRDPRRLPYRWRREDGRLACRLRPLTDGERLFLTTECVADRPDIELRIAAPPGREPFLAEVIFPPATPIAEAKAYLFHELSELPASACGHAFRWCEDAERVLLRLDDDPASCAVPVALAEGVCELVADEGAWHTCRIEFDRRAGWSLPRAEDWAERHLGVRDLGRTARLVVPHRMEPPLAAVVTDILYRGDGAISSEPRTQRSEVSGGTMQFVPVPADRRGGRAEATRGAPAKGGAGLETDLADVPHGDRLPGELRSVLPRRGVVNYMEAAALVRALEKIAADGAPSLAVIALGPAQAELIRLLVRRSPALARGPLPRVDVPAGFREEEFDTVLLSLTRSHAHRAVALGEGPAQLALALTRARRRLVVFGDAGTLARRGQFAGPVDHLDEAAAARERDIVGRLLEYVHGRGPHGGAFAVAEGSMS